MKIIMDEKIKNGAFQIARQLFDSELWIEKPSSWKIIWIYILGKVNHQDNKQFERGEGFFNFTQELKQIGRDITYDMIRHSMTYFKRNGMLSTTKSTRGIIVKVLKYNKFQKLENYKSTIVSTTKAQPKHNQSTTINKNVKNANNVKNDKNTTIAPSDKNHSELKPIITITLNDKTEYPITQDMVTEWKSLYPAVDILQALRDIRGWNLSKPRQRKTKRGIMSHINTWLSKEQNSGSYNKPSNNKGGSYGQIKRHTDKYPEGRVI